MHTLKEHAPKEMCPSGPKNTDKNTDSDDDSGQDPLSEDASYNIKICIPSTIPIQTSTRAVHIPYTASHF